MIAIAVVVTILLIFLVNESRSLHDKMVLYEAKATTLAEQIEEEQNRTQEIEDLKKYMQTDEYVEEVARERLGLVKDNEIVFKEAE
ncbi:MAG: septum formation initiator family protein [Eubacteriales bacterium]|nr:septum formation initiator family protein [Eubacteriales bacterium]